MIAYFVLLSETTDVVTESTHRAPIAVASKVVETNAAFARMRLLYLLGVMKVLAVVTNASSLYKVVTNWNLF